jgi:hypothetical protein
LLAADEFKKSSDRAPQQIHFYLPACRQKVGVSALGGWQQANVVLRCFSSLL